MAYKRRTLEKDMDMKKIKKMIINYEYFKNGYNMVGGTDISVSNLKFITPHTVSCTITFNHYEDKYKEIYDEIYYPLIVLKKWEDEHNGNGRNVKQWKHCREDSK